MSGMKRHRVEIESNRACVRVVRRVHDIVSLMVAVAFDVAEMERRLRHIRNSENETGQSLRVRHTLT